MDNNIYKEEEIMETILNQKTPSTQKTYRNAYKLLKRVVKAVKDEDKSLLEYDVNELLDLIKDVNYLKENTKAGLVNIYYLIVKHVGDDEKMKIIDERRTEIKLKLHRERVKKNKCFIG